MEQSPVRARARPGRRHRRQISRRNLPRCALPAPPATSWPAKSSSRRPPRARSAAEADAQGLRRPSTSQPAEHPREPESTLRSSMPGMLGRLGTALLARRGGAGHEYGRHQPAPDAGGRPDRTGPRRIAVATQRQLFDRRRAGSGVTHGHRPQRRLVAQHQRTSHQRAAVSSLLERVAQHRLHLDARAAARRPRARRPI